MGRIETRIKEAAERYKKDGDLQEFAKEVADVGDRSVNCKHHAAIMYDAIRQYCSKPLFECVFYDGENGGIYHLLDFDPNGLSKESLLTDIKARLAHQLNLDPDFLDKAMETVYLLNTNALIKVQSER